MGKPRLLSNKIQIFSKKKVLVTGASGLIGFNLLSTLNSYLLEIDNLEIIITSLNPLPEYIEKELEGLNYKHYSHEEFKEDFCNSKEYFDLIYYCAGYGQPKKFISNPFATVEVNTSDLIFAAKLLKNDGKMFYMSSSEIYTNSGTMRPKEDDIGSVNPEHERAIYIESKKLGESICWALREHGKNVIILRISLVFGPGTKINDQRVLNELIVRGIKNNKVDLQDAGNAIRTYLSVDQCIYWIISLTKDNIFNVYNLSGNHKIIIRELATIISEILAVPLEFGEEVLMVAPNLVEVDNNRISHEHPFNEQESLSLKLREVIDWYRMLLSKHKY
jgi:nucleoside-diphosphate-sugar epimerase